ncbi:MAG: M28 family metallopeptidase, partial [Candidatus Cloacimonadaceae bacterium]|nr:M28 family metallopeptidase [Candidatus Cloacimonadaceae bacterium]
MKQVLALLIVFFCIAGLSATPQELAIFRIAPFLEFTGCTDLAVALQKPVASDIELYYHNDKFVIAGLSSACLATFPRGMIAKTLKLPHPGKLYLSSVEPQIAAASSTRNARLVYDMETVSLYESDLSILELRKESAQQFTPLRMVPVKLFPEYRTVYPVEERNPVISGLVNQVNPDSVIWFIQSLENFQTRFCLADNRLAVSEWIRDQFYRFGITDVGLHVFDMNGYLQYNVVATIPGTENPDKYIVVGGHHDSIVYPGDPLIFAPGADDNATGTAAALEMARVMKSQNYQPRNSIRFITFAAEEAGLYGSWAYASEAALAQQDIILMINHDMIGTSNQTPDVWQVKISPYSGYVDYTLKAMQLTEQYTSLTPTLADMNSSNSDSFCFWLNDYPVTYFKEFDFSPYYHSTQDLTIHVNADFCAEVIKASTAVAVTYGNMLPAPRMLWTTDTGTGSSLLVSWPNSPSPDLASYKIYHNNHGSYFDNPISVSVQPGELTSHTITGLPEGQACYIAVSSVAVNGDESSKVYGLGTPYS